MNLKNFTDKELLEELENRKKSKPKRPKHKSEENICIKGIIDACESFMDNIENGHPEPEKQYIFEAAIGAVYGDEVWNWINQNAV